MFAIHIHTDDKALLEYLHYEGTKVEKNSFEFSSYRRAAQVLARYLFFEIKNETLHKLIPDDKNFENDIESFLMFVPYDYEEMWKKRVLKLVEEYLFDESVIEFYIDGFLTFRLADIKRKYFNFLQEEYKHFLSATEPTESLLTMIEFMNSQPLHVEEIIIETQENGNIVIKQGQTCFYIETQGEQENIVVQSVSLSPKRVKLIDRYKVLRKELIIVLKQLFGLNLSIIRSNERVT